MDNIQVWIHVGIDLTITGLPILKTFSNLKDIDL